jgi:hypothetical protein
MSDIVSIRPNKVYTSHPASLAATINFLLLSKNLFSAGE